MTSDNTLYDDLGLSPRASAAVIRAAYRCLAQQYHPDKNDGAAAAHDRQAQINRAYAILSNPQQREAYDRRMGLNASHPERRGVPVEARYNGLAAAAGQTLSRPFVFRPL